MVLSLIWGPDHRFEERSVHYISGKWTVIGRLMDLMAVSLTPGELF